MINRLTAAAAFASMACVPAARAGDFEMFVPEIFQGFADTYRAAPAVRAGDFVHISGVVAGLGEDQARTPETYEAAIRDAFARVEEVLGSAGASWSDVIEVTTFHVGMRDHQEIVAEVRKEFVTDKPYPTWTAIGVEKLWSDHLFLEIRVIAYLGD